MYFHNYKKIHFFEEDFLLKNYSSKFNFTESEGNMCRNTLLEKIQFFICILKHDLRGCLNIWNSVVLFLNVSNSSC